MLLKTKKYFDTTEEFYDECRQVLDNSDDVNINSENYSNFDKHFKKKPAPVSWEWCLSDRAKTLPEIFGEFLTNAALNGGYWYDTDPVKQWEVEGSGSRALAEWIESLHKRNLHPLYTDEPIIVTNMLKSEILAMPNPAKRLDIFTELGLISNQVAHDVMDKWFLNGYHFEFKHIQDLSLRLTKCFGGDPFLKKACLVFLMFAGWLRSNGYDVTVDLPIPSDYQMPRIFEYEDVIEISDGLRSLLKEERIIDVNNDAVIALRAAAVLAAHDLALRYHLSDYEIDSVLFPKYRKDRNFKKYSIPPMRCLSMWF